MDIAAAWILLAASVAPAIPLRPGTYVQRGNSCADAPFAAMRSWDGKGFGGPHDSACTTRVLRKKGYGLEVGTVCRALGDGTPTTPTEERARVEILTPSTYRYGVLVEGKLTGMTAYRRCGR